ncbi:MAG: ParB N-terminal domain-containing protein [Oligoflexales bacterium]|nr:ParB N-terminal domain-containing protein [Oligoflexales bacterium]
MAKKKAENVDQRSSHVTDSLENYAKLDEDRSLFPPERFEKILAALEKSDRVNANVPVSIIVENENIRRENRDNDNDFIETIRKEGLNQHPIITIRKTENGNYQFLMVGGHRRLRAFKSLGHRQIPCVVRNFEGEKERLVASFNENQKRKNMDLFDIGKSFSIFRERGMSFEEISDVSGLDLSNVRRYVHFNNWSEDIVNLVRENKELFPVRFLNKFASKKYSNEQILAELNKKITNKPVAGKTKRVGATQKNYDSISGTVKNFKLSPDEISLISKVLIESKIIAKPLDQNL